MFHGLHKDIETKIYDSGTCEIRTSHRCHILRFVLISGFKLVLEKKFEVSSFHRMSSFRRVAVHRFHCIGSGMGMRVTFCSSLLLWDRVGMKTFRKCSASTLSQHFDYRLKDTGLNLAVCSLNCN
jgi:hypothetical protein